MPKDVEIACPSCRSSAKFEAPFLVHDEMPTSATGRVVRSGGWFIEERFPELVSWEDPDNAARHNYGAAQSVLGVARCPHCSLPRRHLLDWPADSYFNCQIRGESLWAWNREHMVRIRDYILMEHRPPRSNYGGLGKVPTHFLVAKHREAAVKAIERALTRSR